jgi:hypothetical protein
VQPDESQADVSEKHVASIFRVEEGVKQEASVKQNSACCLPHACSWIVSIKQSSACCLLYAGFLFGAFFDTAEEGDTILRNVG